RLKYIVMLCNKLLLLVCTVAICAWQMASALPTNILRPIKASTTLHRLGGFVCVRKADLDALQSMAFAEESMLGFRRKRGPEVIFEVE
ncbi:hypothetical protein TSMEX_007768, partial [Taenia solium]